MIPLAAFDIPSIWQQLATVFAAMAVWAQRHATPDRDAYQELAYRLRHPLRHSLCHPVSAAVCLKKKMDRRRTHAD